MKSMKMKVVYKRRIIDIYQINKVENLKLPVLFVGKKVETRHHFHSNYDDSQSTRLKTHFQTLQAGEHFYSESKIREA